MVRVASTPGYTMMIAFAEVVPDHERVFYPNALTDSIL